MYDPSKPYKTQIFTLIEKTWNTPFMTVRKNMYPVFDEKVSGWKVDHTDGIGTKGEYHWAQKTIRHAVLDALAMNLNDLALVRATPYKLQNHLTLPEDNHKYILEMITCLSEECRKRNIAMTGGETSIHENSTTMDFSITVSGFITDLRPNACKAGDTLIAIKSNGLHSNGFTKIRELFTDSNRKEFTQPTRIYLDDILRICENHRVNGMMHITGGAFTKLKDIAEGVGIKINTYNLPEIFSKIYDRGISDEVMYTTFNCGVGFILSVPQSEKEGILNSVNDTFEIGEVTEGSGKIIIDSNFSEQTVTL